MGDQGGGGRQARALRKADGADRLRGRRDDPCGAQGRHLSRRSLHVPPASADAEAGRAGQVGRDRRGQDDQVELRLRHAGLHARAPALRQRSRRRRHSGCRRLSGLDGAADRRGGSRAAVRRSGAGGGHRASRPVRRRRMGVGGAALSRRHRRRGVLQHLAQPGQCAAHPRHQGPHRGQGFLVRRRQGGRHRQDRHHPPGRQRDVDVKEDGWLYSFEADAAGEAIPPARQEFAWPGMGWADSLGNLACSTNGAPASGSNTGSRRPASRVNTISGRKLRPGGTAILQRAIPGLSPPASIVALGFEDFRTFSSGSILLDAFFEAGGNLFDTGFVYGAGRTEALLGEWHGQPRRARAIGDHRQGRALAALLSRRHRQAADAIARPAADRSRRHLFHAPRQPGRAGRRVRRRHGRRGQGGPHPRAVRRLELDQRAHGRGDRLCRADRQAEARRALQQFLAGRDAGADLAGLHHLVQRRMEGTG